MLPVADDAGPCLCVRKTEPTLPTEQLVEAGCASRREKRDAPTRDDLVVQPLHGQRADGRPLAFRLSSYRFDVANGAPWLVTESDQPRDSAGMADEMVAISYENVHTAEGVVGVIVLETLTERPLPQPAQCRPGCCVDLVTLKHGDIHNLNLTSGPVPSRSSA